MKPRTIVVGDYLHTTVIKDGTIQIEGVDCEFPEVQPINKAFARMARKLEFDVSEMAIATYLQAREAKKPITLLPIVLGGQNHHRSINAWPGNNVTPSDLKGKKVGVRAYSQTTGLWVRGLLKEEYGIESGDMTWVTTEEPHVAEYVEPPYVERTAASLGELLRAGEIIAAVMGASSLVKKEGVELVSVMPHPDEADIAWGERHHTIPINHMLTVQTDLLNSDPKVVANVYKAFTRAIDETASERPAPPKGKAVFYGPTDTLLRSVELAIKYGLEQEMLREEITGEEIFADARKYMNV